MPALVAGIHVLGANSRKDVDGRVKAGHDEVTPYVAFAVTIQTDPASGTVCPRA